MKDFSKIVKPLFDFLMQGVPFFFEEDCNQAFLTLMEKLISTPIVVTLNWELPFKLMCDARDYAVGAVLGQKRDKVLHAMYYVSRTLNEAKLNYATIEK